MYCEALRSLARSLFRRKSLAEASSMETPLKRCLSTWDMVFYGVAQMAGAGIYVLIGTVIKDQAGPAAVFSFALCAVASLFTGLCYVEFSTLVPRAGSCYTFTYIAMGELPAFIVGWTMLSDLLLAVASVAKSFSSTVDALTGRAISNFTTSRMPLPAASFLDTGPDWIAFGLILVAAGVTVTGAAASMRLTAAITIVQLLLLAAITVGCFALGSPTNWTEFSPYGLGGVLKGATVAVFAFSGFEALANAAEECENPRRSMPVALLSSLGIICGLYLAACLGLSYLVYYKDLDIGSPFVLGFARSRVPWLQYLAAAGTLLATSATKFSSVYIVPRMFYALASDRVIFACFAEVHPRLGVPLAGLAVGAAISSVAALLINVETLATLYSLGTLLSYLAVGVNLYILRHLHDSRRQPTLRSWAPAIMSRCNGNSTVVKAMLAAYTLACVLLGVASNSAAPLGLWWGWLITGLATAPPLLTAIGLCAFEPARPPHGAYESPLMPLAPLLAVLVNGLLLASLQPLTWLRFLVWTAIGLLIYGLYGFRHSRAAAVTEEYESLGGKDSCDNAAPPDEETHLS